MRKSPYLFVVFFLFLLSGVYSAIDQVARLLPVFASSGMMYLATSAAFLKKDYFRHV